MAALSNTVCRQPHPLCSHWSLNGKFPLFHKAVGPVEAAVGGWEEARPGFLCSRLPEPCCQERPGLQRTLGLLRGRTFSLDSALTAEAPVGEAYCQPQLMFLRGAEEPCSLCPRILGCHSRKQHCGRPGWQRALLPRTRAVALTGTCSHLERTD